jgi:hypothetical protein
LNSYGHPDAAEHDLDSRISQDGVEQFRELAVSIPDQEPDPASSILQAHDQVPGSLGHPGNAGVPGRAQDTDPATAVLDDCKHEQARPGQRHVSRKSHASSASAWKLRKSAQVVRARSGAGSIPACLRISQTVEAATHTPSTAVHRARAGTPSGANVAAVLAKIVPVTRGWAAYYRTVVSSRVFRALDDYLWKLTYKRACRSHSNKPKGWIVGRYFRKFEKSRNDRWVFGDKDTGAYLPRLAWTDIVRHTLVKGGASPDDPALAGYWAQRRQKVKPPLDSYTVRLLSRQDGRCSLCGENLLTPDQPQSPQDWEHWHLRVTRKAIKAGYLVHHDTPSAARSKRTHLVHATCHRSKHWPRTAGNTVMQAN